MPAHQSLADLRASWREAIARYQHASSGRSAWEIANSLVPYLLLWALMIFSFRYSYLLTLTLSVLAAGFLMRIFIIFHDCTHGSFLKQQWANDILGTITGIITFTPYYQWRYSHVTHHATVGNLDQRGTGDVWTLTVSEYEALSRIRRFFYRVYRHPFVMFILGPTFIFFLSNRFVQKGSGTKERVSVYLTNLALVAIAFGMHRLIGIKAYVMIQLPTMLLAGMAGVWLFYVQHQFEGTYWEERKDWDYVTAAIQGSSYYKLPRILQWFSGNIGLHHIHHLSPRIPNYYLQRCLDNNPMFQVKPVTMLSSLRAITFNLWDGKSRRMISFGEWRVLRVERGAVRA